MAQVERCSDHAASKTRAMHFMKKKYIYLEKKSEVNL